MHRIHIGLRITAAIVLAAGLWLPGLLGDEAYYAYWAETPSAGYFDHPPMVAWCIAAGQWLLPGIAGVRLLFLLMALVSLFVFTRKGTLPATLLWIFVVPWAIPDGPLLFFLLAWFWAYEKFRPTEKPVWGFLLALSFAGLFLSKWNGPLIPLVFLLIQIRKNGLKALLWTLAGTAGAAPYLWWLLRYGESSFHYHLVERHEGVNLMYLLLPLAGCLLLLPAQWNVWKNKPVWATQAVYLVLLGLFSLQGSFELNWLVPLIPLLQYQPGRVFPLHLTAICFGIALLVRGLLYLPLLQSPVSSLAQVSEKKAQMTLLAERAGDTTVVFINSYMEASWYRFYTGQKAISWNNLNYRRNQYDFEDFPDPPYLVVVNWQYHPKDPFCNLLQEITDSLETPGKKWFYFRADSLPYTKAGTIRIDSTASYQGATRYYLHTDQADFPLWVTVRKNGLVTQLYPAVAGSSGIGYFTGDVQIPATEKGMEVYAGPGVGCYPTDVRSLKLYPR